MPTTIPNISSTKHEGFKNKKSKQKKDLGTNLKKCPLFIILCTKYVKKINRTFFQFNALSHLMYQ